MTDGERLVWAASFAIVFDRDGDSVSAAGAAMRAVVEMRDAVTRKVDGVLAVSHADARDFLDEMVNAP